MNGTSTMTISPLLPVEKESRDSSKSPSSSIVIAPHPCAPSLNSGATVFVHDSTTIHGSRMPELQSVNGHHQAATCDGQSTRGSHVVKININPKRGPSRAVSSVTLNLVKDKSRRDSAVVQSATENQQLSGASDSFVRMSFVAKQQKEQERAELEAEPEFKQMNKSTKVDDSLTSGSNRSCFYFHNSLMSSGQCSPSDTLDSGTCSDLDGTPPPLPKKKNSSTVLLCNGQHNRTGSLTSSGAEVDSDDNESNVSCDSLNNADLSKRFSRNKNNANICDYDAQSQILAQGTALTFPDITLNDQLHSKANTSFFPAATMLNNPVAKVTQNGYTTFEEVMPVMNVCNDKQSNSELRGDSQIPSNNVTEGSMHSVVVEECTYQERKLEMLERESATLESYTDLSRSKKYIYEDDRFYKFHLNECRNEQESTFDHTKNEDDECFAGFKILERDAIRSAKGTVRGVKNRVRAGIATFLQKPSIKEGMVDNHEPDICL